MSGPRIKEKRVHKRSRTGPRIVVVRALRGLGDALVAIPALRLLRASLPDAEITIIGIDTVRPVFERFSGYFDRFVAFGDWPGIPEHSEHADPIELETCRGAELLLQLHGDGCVMNAFCASLEPRRLVTFGPCTLSGDIEVDTRAYPRHAHEVTRCLDATRRALRLLGAEPVPFDTSLEFPLTAEDEAEADVVREESGLEACPYAVLHPGAHLADRRWPPEGFGAVGRTLARAGIVPVITGDKDETGLARHTANLCGRPSVPIAGRLSVGGTAAILAGARVVITNDTGISHLATAVGAPSVVVFTASDPHRWAPLDTTQHRAVVREATDWDPTARITPEGHRIATPSVSDTLHELEALGVAT